MSIFDSIFDDFSFFGKPYVVYNCNGIRDLTPTVWHETNEGFRCLAKTLGINEIDIKITIEDYGIELKGKSEIEGNTWDTTLKLPVNQQVLNNLKEIKFKSLNGITYIDLVLDKQQKKKILINGK